MLKTNTYWSVTILTLGMVLSMPYLGIAQNNCTQRLKEANDLYDQGRLVEVVKALKEGDCLEDGFTKEERTRAYKLLSLVYIFMDDEVNAEESVISLLTVDPEHPLDSKEPAEFISMYNKYRSDPIFRVGGYMGTSYNSVNVLTHYGTFGSDQGISKAYTPKLGFHIGGSFEYMPIENLETILRVEYGIQNYGVTYNNIASASDDAASDFMTTIEESQTWLSIPLLVRYNVPLGGETGRYTPYALAGASFRYLVAANLTGSAEGLATKDVTAEMKGLGLRRAINWNYTIGGGVKIDVKRTNSLFFELAYNIGGRNIVDPNGKRDLFSNDKSIDLRHEDDHFTMNAVVLSVGWIRSIYNPKRYSDKKLSKQGKI